MGIHCEKPGEGQCKSQIVTDYLGIGLLAVGVGALHYVLEKGQPDDWFDDEAIRWCCFLAVFADVADLDVVFPEEDTRGHPLRVKGKGDLGIVDETAVANAISHATGQRLTSLPTRLNKLLAAKLNQG